MIDLHSHLLPGLDDGPETLAESVDMARAMAADGVTIVCATPHVRDDWPTTAEEMERALAATQDAVSRAGIGISVRGGGEIDLERLFLLDQDERGRFGLGGNPHLLLIETPYRGWPLSFAHVCAELVRDGFQPVIAHPERNPDVMERPTLLHDVVGAGAVIQLTAASVDGRLGRRLAACARQLLELGLAHVIASDAHASWLRELGLSAAAKVVGDPGLGRWLVEDAPAALLAGEALPPAPAYSPRRRGRFGRARR